MADAMWMKIRAVRWQDYETSHGDGSCLPTILNHLGSRKSARAMRSSQQLWSALCGGGVIHSAIVPAAELLREIFLISEPAVQEGILDVFLKAQNAEITHDWSHDLERVFIRVKQTLASARVRDEIVKDKLSEFL